MGQFLIMPYIAAVLPVFKEFVRTQTGKIYSPGQTRAGIPISAAAHSRFCAPLLYP